MKPNDKDLIELLYMMPLGDDKVKEGKGLKFLTPNRLLTRLQVLLAQINAGNNSHKLKKEIRQIPYLLYQHKEIYSN